MAIRRFMKFGARKVRVIYEHSRKELDPIKGIVTVPSKSIKFEPNFLAVACSISIDDSTDEGKKKIEAIEKLSSYAGKLEEDVGNINTVYEVPLDYIPIEERPVEKVEEKPQEFFPKYKIQKMYKTGSTYVCAFCGWRGLGSSKSIIISHLASVHGVKSVPNRNGAKIEATYGAYKGKTVSIVYDKEAEMRILTGAVVEDVGETASVGDMVYFIYETARGTSKIVGKILKENKLHITLELKDSSVKNFRRANIVTEPEVIIDESSGDNR